MKKRRLSLLVFFFTAVLCFTQNFLPKGTYRSPFAISAAEKNKVKDSDGKSTPNQGVKSYYFIPVIGYGSLYIPGDLGNGLANIGILGLDFGYEHKSGFVLYFNNSFNFGTAYHTARPYKGSSSLYPHEGVDSKQSGIAGWSGELLFGYAKKIQKHRIGFGLGYQTSVNIGESSAIEFGAFAVRLDYSYFFKEKIGISLALTEGLGGGFIGNSGGFMNAFSLKLGPNFKL